MKAGVNARQGEPKAQYIDPPQVREFTLAEARAKLESERLSGEAAAQGMLREIDQLLVYEASEYDRLPASKVRAGAIVVLITALGIIPGIILFALVDSDDSLLSASLVKVPVAFWAGWALFSVWAGLSADELSEMLGEKTERFGPRAVCLFVLALVNCGAVLVFLFARGGFRF
jgi:hypothetical protein